MKLFFDLDGTLADPFRAFCSSVRFAAASLGIEEPSEATLRKCIGPPLRNSVVSIMGVSQPDVAEKFVALYREHHGRDALFEYQFYDGVEEALEALCARNQLYVVTSKPWAFARPIVEHFGLARYFREIYGPELDGTRDNKGELIRHILARESIRPAEAVMIGDRKHDILAAKANQVASIGVTWGYGSKEELVENGADRIVEGFAQLVRSFD